MLPSIYEGTPTTLLEAMAYGKAIVCSDLPSTRALIKENHNGLLVNLKSEDIARVGLATEVNTKIYFDSFIRRFEGKVLEVQAGPIPVYEPNIGIQKDNVYLVGDSACQIKNTTGGGIVFGMLSAKVLADCIISQKDYKTQIMRKLWKDLTMHYWMRKFLDKFTDKDYDDLINLVKKDTVKDVLEEYDREFPSKFLFKLLMREPRFLKFASKFLLGL